MKNQMYIDSVLKDSYSNNVCSDSSRSSPLSIICDKKDIGQGPSVNGHPLPRGQDGLPTQQHSGQTPFLPQSHPNLPIDSSIIGGSLNISGSCSSSATPSPSSAKSSKLTPHKGPMSTAGCGEILAAQLFNHEQQVGIVLLLLNPLSTFTVISLNPAPPQSQSYNLIHHNRRIS